MISIISDKIKYTGVTLDNPYKAVIPDGVTAIIGPNGGGKSSLANIIENGWNFMTNHLESSLCHRPRVRSISFSDLHSLTGFTTEYYQQRYESMMNDDIPTVRQLLGDKLESDLWPDICAQLNFANALDKKANYLSSGELRKMLIINMLFETPDLLVLDNPYIGLDVNARKVIDDTIRAISERGTSIMLLVSDVNDIPESAVAAIAVCDLCIYATEMRSSYANLTDFRNSFNRYFPKLDTDQDIADFFSSVKSHDLIADNDIVALRHCKVCYGKRTLINDINWQIKAGECWALTGANGSGKSTLLSLINADNPQAYSNDISLFGRRRGSGECIWDIKRRIGFLSSELHLYFRDGGSTPRQIIARCMKDTPSDFGQLSDDRMAMLEKWIKLFKIDSYADKPFRTISFGQQRLTLLIGALAKMPELLILDEPLHGLDQAVKRAVTAVVEAMSEKGTTIIYVTHVPTEMPLTVTHTKHLS